MSRPLPFSQPNRPDKKARRYSTACTRPVRVGGTPACTTAPFSTWQPLRGRTTPPAATTRSSRANWQDSFFKASGSRRPSASTQHTSGYRAAFSPAFSASALPPFSLSTTMRSRRLSLMNSPRTCPQGRGPSPAGSSGRSPNSCRSRSRVPSAEPSFTTMTSKRG